jgi:hypothetical protein
MGRHAKPKEEQRQQIGFRLSPADRHRLEAAASRSGVSVPQEVEVRLISSLDQDEMIDGPTAELIGQIAAQIAEIQKMTGKRWHKDVTTWAAVHEMLRRREAAWAPGKDARGMVVEGHWPPSDQVRRARFLRL